MSAERPSGERSIVVNASPDAVYAVVSDITRTPEWSPECVACEWTGTSSVSAEGATFRGTNRQGQREWSMDAVVDEAVPGQRFSFHTERDGEPRTRWGWRLEPASTGGTTVTQFYERLAPIGRAQRIAERALLGGREKHNAKNMETSLERVKAVIEGA